MARSGHCPPPCSLPLCKAIRQAGSKSPDIRSQPSRGLIPNRHCMSSYFFVHHLVHAIRFRLASCFRAEFMPAAEGQGDPWPSRSLASTKKTKDIFLFGLIFEWSEQVYTRSVCLVLHTKCELLRKCHKPLRTRCRPLQKHPTVSKLSINLQGVTGELLHDCVLPWLAHRPFPKATWAPKPTFDVHLNATHCTHDHSLPLNFQAQITTHLCFDKPSFFCRLHRLSD